MSRLGHGIIEYETDCIRDTNSVILVVIGLLRIMTQCEEPKMSIGMLLMSVWFGCSGVDKSEDILKVKGVGRENVSSGTTV